ncbi:MAG: membrane-bound lytic murein transglycosylase D, partial [Psychromonas sp.]
MKKFIPLFICLSFNLKAQSGYSIPETPRQIEFANVVVNLDSYAQKTVNNHVTSLLTPQNSYLDSKLELMQWYFPYIEAILEKENVPDDLKYLAVQESNLKPDALSSSAAVGFWQFKEPTGKELGLRIDNNIDERKYLDASTKAAARYFKKNNIIFKNWISCIYAYNQGPTGASKEIPDSWSYA